MRVRADFRLLAAAILVAAALLLPLWGFRMSAPQYPGESLHLRVTQAGIAGDVQEVTTLQQYIGVHFPTRLDELRWIKLALGSLALLLAASAFSGTQTFGRRLKRGAALLLLAFVLASTLFMQWRLYETGHHRDLHAPLRAVKNFTPMVLGPTRVGNFTVWSYPHFGGLALALALVLAMGAAFCRRCNRAEQKNAQPLAEDPKTA